MQEKQVQLIRLSEMTPNISRKSGVEQKPVSFVRPSTVEVEEKTVDLVSVTSEDYKDDDQISFDEGRLQQWNYAEFQMQLLSAMAGIVLLFGCGIMSAWAVTDLIKDIQVNEAEWVDLDYSFELFDSDEEDFLASRHVIIAMVVLSYNVGCIVGGICGAFITPLLPNRAIYVRSNNFHCFNLHNLCAICKSIFYFTENLFSDIGIDMHAIHRDNAYTSHVSILLCEIAFGDGFNFRFSSTDADCSGGRIDDEKSATLDFGDCGLC